SLKGRDPAHDYPLEGVCSWAQSLHRPDITKLWTLAWYPGGRGTEAFPSIHSTLPQCRHLKWMWSWEWTCFFPPQLEQMAKYCLPSSPTIRCTLPSSQKLLSTL